MSSSSAQTVIARRRLEALVESLPSTAQFDEQQQQQQQPSTFPTTSAFSFSSSSSSSTSANDGDSDTSLPPIVTVATPSAGPRTKSKIVIITGADSPKGIGRAAAHQFAQNGARAVYVCDYIDDHLAAHKKEIEAAHPSCTVHPVQLDVSDEAAVKAVVEDAVKRYGRLDVMFANAGVSGGVTPFDETDADEFFDIMRVNALGVFLCFKHAAIAMKRCIADRGQVGGSLIGTASVAGLRSNAGGTAYSASKAAVVSMAQTVAYQLVGTGIRCNSICPGFIETGMTQLVFDMARARGTERKLGQLNPLKRAGVADEIARVVLFLGSDESSYVNGQAWTIDGGLSAGHPYVPGKMA